MSVSGWFDTRRWWTMQNNFGHSNLLSKFFINSPAKLMFRVRSAKSFDFNAYNDFGENLHDKTNLKLCNDDNGEGRQNDSDRRLLWSRELSDNPPRNINVFQIVFANLSVMISLGICVITGHVANDVAGPAVISSLIIAAVTSLLSGLCYTEFQTNRSPSSRNIYNCFYQNVGEFPAFLVGWNQILLHATAIAASGRSLSSILDYLSGHQLEEFWNERLPRISVFNASPDLIAFSFVILATLPFGLGMRWLKRLSYLLTVLVLLVASLFVVLGASYVDTKGWSSHHFLTYESTRLLSGAAIFTCAFCSYFLTTNSKPPKTPKRCIPIVIGATLTICFVMYFIVAVVSTLLVQKRNVNSDASLVEIFEAYNLHWAVYVVGAGDVLCLGLLMLNLANNLNLTTLMLSADGLIFRCISRKWNPLKTSLVPALLFGGGAGIAAILFPILGLLEVMALPSLTINTLICLCVLYQRYQPIDSWQYLPLPQDDCSPLLSPTYPTRRMPSSNEESHPDNESSAEVQKSLRDSGIHINKRDIFPLVKQSSFSSAESGSTEDSGQLKPQFSFDSDLSIAEVEQESDAESSCTDIDTIVAEYKEKLRVATLTDSVGFSLGLNLQQPFTLNERNYERCPTLASGRRVLISVVGLVIVYFILSFVLVLKKDAVARGNPFIIIFLSGLVFIVIVFLVVILRQPETGYDSQSNSGRGLPNKVFQVPFLPWIPAIAAFLNVCMLTNILCRHWAPGLVWLILGIAIYFVYGIWNSTVAIGSNKNRQALKEKIRLKPLPRQPLLSSVLPIHDHNSDINQRITEVDTILISR